MSDRSSNRNYADKLLMVTPNSEQSQSFQGANRGLFPLTSESCTYCPIQKRIMKSLLQVNISQGHHSSPCGICTLQVGFRVQQRRPNLTPNSSKCQTIIGTYPFYKEIYSGWQDGTSWHFISAQCLFLFLLHRILTLCRAGTNYSQRLLCSITGSHYSLLVD